MIFSYFRKPDTNHEDTHPICIALSYGSGGKDTQQCRVTGRHAEITVLTGQLYVEYRFNYNTPPRCRNFKLESISHYAACCSFAIRSAASNTSSIVPCI